MEKQQIARAANLTNVQVRGIKVKRKAMFDQNSKMLLNGVQLSFQKGFGFNQNSQIKNNAYSMDDNRLIYILSKQIVVYDNLAESQKIIDQLNHEQQFTSFLYFKNIMLDDNVIFAVQSAWKSSPMVILHNFSKGVRNKFILTHLEKQQKVIEIVLVNQNHNFAIISQLEGCFRLSIMEIQSKKLYASENLYFKPLGMLVPNHYPKYIIIYSEKEINLVIMDKEIKITPLGLRKYITDQTEKVVRMVSCLHSDLTLYVITTKGYIHFININLISLQVSLMDSEFLGNYETIDEKGDYVVRNKCPSSICCNEYNILIGYQHVEELTLVKVCRVASQKTGLQTIKFCCPYLHKIVKMNFACETMAVCIVVQVKQNDKYQLTIPIQSQFLKEKGEDKTVKQNILNHNLKPGKIFPVIFNLLLHDTLVQTLRSPVQPILNSMLMIKPILDISILSTKKLILVLSAQKKIKAIKYEHVSSTSFERMLAWETNFNSNDNPSSLDAHPLTFHVAVGLKEGIKIFNICSEGLKSTNIQFNLKNCQSVRYSRFGHKLVAGCSNQIVIINPYKHQIQQTIHLGYGFNVREISFIDRDMYLFGLFSNGSSMVLNLEGSKIIEVGSKSTKLQHMKVLCSAYDKQFDILAISYENRILFYKDHGNQQFSSDFTETTYTRILIVNQLATIFFGTSLGSIRAHQWPFTDRSKFRQNFTSIQLHNSPITQLQITHDFSMIISGAQDGSVFISKINAYADGIVVNDSEMMHAFRTVNKNYMSLYYLQNYMCTNSSIQSELEEMIVQLESDKADFQSEYNDVIMTIHQNMDEKIKQEEKNKSNTLRELMVPHEKTIEELNFKKLKLKEQLFAISTYFKSTQHSSNQEKLSQMRTLYQESDNLQQQKQYYIQLYDEEIRKVTKQYESELGRLNNIQTIKMKQLEDKCKKLEQQCQQGVITYQELMKEEDIEGEIYKKRMLAQMQSQLEKEHQRGENQRKKINKRNHQILKQKEKKKYFEQLIKDLEIQKENTTKKDIELKQHLVYLTELLSHKDKQIFNEEKIVKELLTNNINNYTHQEYLKHRQDQLLNKAIFLKRQIDDLQHKYKVFQQNFIEASKQTNEYDSQISEAIETIKILKSQYKKFVKFNYQLKYTKSALQSAVMSAYNQNCDDKDALVVEIKKRLSDDEYASYVENQMNEEGKMDQKVEKRDHTIKQVINTNNLRKIGDNIKRTIMVKLNRQTVSLTCQVNQLRKQKRNLTNKIKQLQSNMRELKQNDLDRGNRSTLQQIIPANISIIKSNSKNSKPLPFQLYHMNKQTKQSCHSYKNTPKSQYDQSTQLPSLVKNSHSYTDNSALQGVEENDDEVLQ